MVANTQARMKNQQKKKKNLIGGSDDDEEDEEEEDGEQETKTQITPQLPIIPQIQNIKTEEV